MTATFLVLCTLVYSIKVNAQFDCSDIVPTLSPARNTVIAANSMENVTYTCESPSDPDVFVDWELAGDQDLSSNTNLAIVEKAHTSRLVVTRPEAVHNQPLRCLSKRHSKFGVCPASNPVLIITYDAPNAVRNLNLTYHSETKLRLQWTRPAGIDDAVNITYLVHIMNNSTANVTQMNMTEETYVLVNQTGEGECQPHIFSVTATNDAGNSSASNITESIPINPNVSAISTSQRVDQVLLSDNSVSVTISFQVATSCNNNFPVHYYTLDIEELNEGGTELTATDSKARVTTNISSQQFPNLTVNQRYSVMINACNSFTCRSPKTPLTIFTSDVQTASVVFYKTDAMLNCTFALGSSARGCLIVFSRVMNAGTENVTVPSNNTAGGPFCAQLNETRLAYEKVQVYAIDADNSTVLQPVTVSVTEEEELTDSFFCSPSVNIERRSSSTIIIITAVFIIIIAVVVVLAIVIICWLCMCGSRKQKDLSVAEGKSSEPKDLSVAEGKSSEPMQGEQNVTSFTETGTAKSVTRGGGSGPPVHKTTSPASCAVRDTPGPASYGVQPPTSLQSTVVPGHLRNFGPDVTASSTGVTDEPFRQTMEITDPVSSTEETNTHGPVSSTEETNTRESPIERLEEVVSDEDVEMIAMNHQSDWESLSPLLELSDAQALTVSQLPCEHQSRMCLVLWKAAKGNDATYGALITAAERAGDQQLVDEVKGLVIDASSPIEETRGPTFCLDEKRGLAVLVTCDYKDTSLDKLDTCNTDAQKMKDALLALDYDVHQLKNKEATKCKVELLLRNLSKYLNRYKGNHENGDGQKKAIIVAFAGHGRKGDYIVTHDDKQLHVPNHIVNRLFKFESPKVRKIPKLFFIDACRGTKQPMPTRGDEVYQHLLGNCRVDYATSPEYVAYDGCKWMQKLAEKLENDDSLQHLVSKVNEEVYRQADSKQQCWTYDRLNTGPLYLKVPRPTQTAAGN